MLPQRCYIAEFTLPYALTERFYEALLDEAPSVTCSEEDERYEGRDPEADTRYKITLFFEIPPDEVYLQDRVTSLAHDCAIQPPTLFFSVMEEEVWVAGGYQPVKHQQIGRFDLHDSAEGRNTSYPKRYELHLAVGQAFGTGDHATTAGCLRAISDLQERRFYPRDALDLGTGTGILAMAMAEVFRACRILAVDIDPKAVAIASYNIRQNHLHKHIQVRQANGLRHPSFRQFARFDLVVANILAAPLKMMAASLAAKVNPGGICILSGILEHQAPQLLGMYRAHGFNFLSLVHDYPWSVLCLQKPHHRR